jgi:chitinase
MKEKNIKSFRLIPVLTIILILWSIVPVKIAWALPGNIWVSAYYAGWTQGCSYIGNDGYLKAEEIDYDAVSHIFHFAIEPNLNGSIDTSINCISSANSEAAVQSAHANGKKILISVGGWDTEAQFLSATKNSNRSTFIDNLINFMVSRGYDGIDIDWEPISSSSASQYSIFITELKEALYETGPDFLLTTAVMWQPSLFAQLQDKFDQINIMTYEMSGPWPGWITWHNGAIYDGWVSFPSTGEPVPSANGDVDEFLQAGVQPEKLGIGIEFQGTVWSGGTGTPTGGVTAPGQSWTSAPSTEMISYYEIMDTYYNPQNYAWDDDAMAAYLSIDNAGSLNDKFISYDNETSCQEKINYVREKGIGGVIIFELAGGWRPAEPVPDKLLQSVKEAAWDTPVTCSNPPVKIGGTQQYYSTLQEAYDSAVSGDTIHCHATEFDENITIDRNIPVILKGGYDCDFTAGSGVTTLNGSLSLDSGKLAIENFILR